MKMKQFTLVIFTLALVFLSCQPTESQSPTIVPIHEEPYHRLVFEKGAIKIMDVQIPPGDTTLFHDHAYPIFFVSLGWPSTNTQKLGEAWDEPAPAWPKGGIDASTSFLSQPIKHRVSNLGNTITRIIGIQHEGNGLKTLPDSTGYEISNQWFQAKRIKLNAGLTHSSLDSIQRVLVMVEGDAFMLTQNGVQSQYERPWMYVEGPYQLLNNEDSSLEIVEVEIK